MNTELTLADYASLLPLLILLGAALLLLLLESFAETVAKKYSSIITLAAIAAALFAAFAVPVSNHPLLTSWLRFDPLSHFFTVFFLVVGFGATLLSNSFFKQFDATHGEYYFLLLSALLGLILIGDSADFLTIFLGLETLSISLYVLCGYMKGWKLSHEAAIKYFLTGSIAAAFLLYGIALVYGAIGTTRLDVLLDGYRGLTVASDKNLFLGGIAMITIGLAFKAAIVPFHTWAPDVYEGAPTPVTAFMAVGTKAGAFAAFIRIFLDALPKFDPLWSEGIAVLAILTLVYANFVALRQVEMKRFFAYSGISHAGFMLIPLAAGTPDALQAIEFYLVVYALATLGAFAVVAYLEGDRRAVLIRDLKGLFRRWPILAGLLALCLLTLAGIPPTAGFFAKFFIFKVAIESGYYVLAIVGLLTAILSAYYYLRIISVMFSEAPAEVGVPISSRSAIIVGAFSFAAILVLSFYPAPFLSLLAIGQ